MASPLTLAMIGQGQLQDPALLPLVQKSQLAQALMQQGTDTSPTTKYGALARALAGITGGLAFNDSQTGYQDAMKQRQQDTLSAMNYMRGTGSIQPGVPSQPSPQAAPAPMTAPATQPTMPPQAPAPTPQLAAAVHTLESGGSNAPGVVGDGGAAGGPMQVHAAALADVNKALGTNYTMDQVVNDPKIGELAGDTYLGLQQQRFPGRPDLALAAYNAGPTATQNAVDKGAGVAGLPPSTQAYVAKGTQLAGVAPGVQPETPQPSAQPPTGVNAPNVASALEMMRRAQEMAIANPL